MGGIDCVIQKSVGIYEYLVCLQAGGSYGSLWNALERFGSLWESLEGFGMLRMALDGFQVYVYK